MTMLPLLRVLQLADTAFPTGMYAHSHGLEGMVRLGLVRTADDVAVVVESYLVWSVAPADGVALLEAARAAGAGDLESLVAMDRLLLAMRWPGELRSAATQVGRRVLQATAGFWERDPDGASARYRDLAAVGDPPGCSAVALGVVAWEAAVPPEQLLAGLFHGAAMGMLNAAQRLMPLGHADAQGILNRLQPVMADLAGEIRGRPWQEMAGFAPELEIAAAEHEHDALRMFAS